MSATRSKQPETLSDALADARQRIEEYMKDIQAELAKIQAILETLA
jgi:hypothetical protein